MRYSRDPYWTTAKFNGKDNQGNTVKRGDRIWYIPASRSVLTGQDAEDAARRFDAERADEDFYNSH